MLQEMIKALLFIFMAEMGDKTQILAMAFATRYKVEKVLIGVLIGSFLNHGLAVILGMYLTKMIPVHMIQLIAACSFIGFGLWTLKDGAEEEEEGQKGKFGPVITVALAFFIGELGDKTQLMAITLATDARFPVFILLGTTLGMVLTSSIGILVGSKLGKRIPEFTMKLISAGVFISFGVIGLFDKVPKAWIRIPSVGLFFAVLAGSIYLLLKPALQRARTGAMSGFQETAASLHIHIQQLRSSVEKLCLGASSCGSCEGKGCAVGFVRSAFQSSAESGQAILSEEYRNIPQAKGKTFDRNQAAIELAEALAKCLNCGQQHQKDCVLNRVREAWEMICLGETLPFDGTISRYLYILRKRDEQTAKQVVAKLEEILFAQERKEKEQVI